MQMKITRISSAADQPHKLMLAAAAACLLLVAALVLASIDLTAPSTTFQAKVLEVPALQ